MIRVVNKHNEPDHIYCGSGSALGNPFIMISENKRDEVCKKYKKWFYTNVSVDTFIDTIKTQDSYLSPILTQLKQLFILSLKEDITLGCFCAPKRCHCDTIKEFLDNQIAIFKSQ